MLQLKLMEEPEKLAFLYVFFYFFVYYLFIWTGSHHTVQTGRELSKLPKLTSDSVLASKVLGSQVCTTTPGSMYIF